MQENPYSDLVATHPSRNANLYSLEDSWEKRIYPLDSQHRDYILKMNLIDKFDTDPIPDSDLSLFKSQLSQISESEPLELKKLKDKHLLGIYFCKNLGGTGLTGFVYKNNKVIGGYIILDSDLLKLNANDWAKYKESTIYSPNSGVLRMVIENETGNSPSSTLEFILNHEFGHIIAFTHDFLPDLSLKYRDFSKFEFSGSTWKSESETIYDKDVFPLRSQIHFYSENSKLTIANHSLEIYSSLENTNFPTLYSATNPDDDFAESFVSYVHVELQNRPYQILWNHRDDSVLSYQNGIAHNRCAKKRKLLSSVFQN